VTGGRPDAGTVTLRYWAAAKEAAGRAEEQVPAASLARTLDEARRRHGARFAAVLGVASLLVDGRRIRPEDDPELLPGAVVEVLPPFAGG
jgi:molybdopterin converting factor small subunit